MTSTDNNLRPYSKIIYYLLFTCLLPAFLHAQQTPQPTSLSSFEIKEDAPGTLSLKYNARQLIHSFLILITDHEGNTVFLESKSRFQGDYAKSVQLTSSPKGEFTVILICDEEKINKKITVK